MLVLLLVLIAPAIAASAVLFGLMLRRNDSFFGVYGLVASIVVGMLALPYGVLAG